LSGNERRMHAVDILDIREVLRIIDGGIIDSKINGSSWRSGSCGLMAAFTASSQADT
jgi:hypothetical protein